MTEEKDIVSQTRKTSLPPVPHLETTVNAGNYRDVPVNRSSLLNSEELVDLASLGISGISYYHISDGSNAPYHQQLNGSISRLLARRTVAEKLFRVNEDLAESGLELFVWDAYRPLATQLGIWKFFEDRVRNENPDMSNEDVYDEVINYVSDPGKFDPDNPETWPTHMTGASIDLTIRHASSHEFLDMGADFDQMDTTAHTCHFEKLLADGLIGVDDVRLQNRRLLYTAMSKHGFTNYPMEYWHYDWGNQMFQMINALRGGGSLSPASYGIVLYDGDEA